MVIDEVGPSYITEVTTDQTHSQFASGATSLSDILVELVVPEGFDFGMF
jgi:hypothetical protein